MTRTARLALGAILSLLLALPGSALAADITVTTTGDEAGGSSACSLREAISAANDDNAGPGSDCTPGSGADDITLGTGTYHVDLNNVGPGGEDANATGDLDITDPVTITGAGAGQTELDQDGFDRVVHVIGVLTAVELEDLTVRGGFAAPGDVGPSGPIDGNPSVGGAGTEGASGGGILNEGDLTLTSVVVANNSAGAGGAGGQGGPALAGASPFGADSIGGTGGNGGSGGGVALDSGSQLTATDTTFDSNLAGAGGDGGEGGAGGAGGSGATGVMGGSSNGGMGGFGGGGGAISADSATVELTRVTVIDNEAGPSGNGGDGGPAGVGGTGTSSGGQGGPSTGGTAIFGGFGGGIYQEDTALTATDSSFVSNESGDGGTGGPGGAAGTGGSGTSQGPGGNSAGGFGGAAGADGAISSSGGSTALIRSTISGNSAEEGGPGGDGGAPGAGISVGSGSGGNGGTGGFTGGLRQVTGVLTITDSTVSGNSAGAGGAGGSGGPGSGDTTGGNGGLGGGEAGVSAPAAASSGTITHATIAANETGAGGPGGAAGSGSSASSGSVGPAGFGGGLRSSSSAGLAVRNTIIAYNAAEQCSGVGYNLSASSNNISFPADSSCPNALEVDPLLGGLGPNGGATFTIALAAGSPAIDAVSANCTATDQRDIPRPRGPACDIGAFERALPAVTTGAFSALTSNSANLAGAVNPNARATTVRFAFGKTAAYGSLTPAVPAGSGVAAVAAAAALTGLEPSTLYHYRATATNGDGTVVGADKTFTTPATPKTTTPTTPPGGKVTAFGGVSILTKSARADRKGRVSVKVRCPAAAVTRCKGKLSLTAKVKRKTVKLGTASFSIAPGKTKTVRIKLSKSKRRLLARSKRLKGSLSASCDRRPRRQGEGQEAQAEREGTEAQAPLIEIRPYGQRPVMARIANRGRRARSEPNAATVAARKGAWGVARIVNLIARVIVAILVVTILFVVFEANRSNGIVEAVLDAGRFLAGPFKDIFNLDNPKTEVAVNYGFAAVAYLLVAGLITRLLVRR